MEWDGYLEDFGNRKLYGLVGCSFFLSCLVVLNFFDCIMEKWESMKRMDVLHTIENRNYMSESTG
jgi:hypothetical protein